MTGMHEKYSWEGIKFEIVFEDSQGNPLDAENMVFRFIYRDEAGQSCIISQNVDERVNCVFRDGKLIGIFEPNTFRRGILTVERRFCREDPDFEKDIARTEGKKLQTSKLYNVMGTCDCAVVQERVIVPEAVAVKESVVVPEIPRINNTVVVPVITAYRARSPYRVDPEWPDLELTPRFHVWLIAYTTGEDPDYDLTFWIYDQVIEVDWGDGTTEILNGREEPGYHTCKHKFKEGTGTLDSHGERFWHVDLYVKEDHAVYNAIELSPVYNNVKSNSKVKAVSINKNGLYSYLILNWAQNTAVNWIEYVRVIGKHILKADTLRSVYLHEIRYDSEDIAFDELPGNTVSKLLGQYPFDVFNYKNIKAYRGAVFSFMYAPNLLIYRYDLSRFNFWRFPISSSRI